MLLLLLLMSVHAVVIVIVKCAYVRPLQAVIDLSNPEAPKALREVSQLTPPPTAARIYHPHHQTSSSSSLRHARPLVSFI